MSFASLGLPEPVLRGVRAAGYTEPTPIQKKAIPLILPGQDLVAAAMTGSGKTAAFILPMLARLMDGPRAVRGLVLVPTRELAAQVDENARAYARHTGVRVASVFGGVPIGPQERVLRHEGVELLIATPGRLLDLHGRHSVSLDEVEILVLDEADRMVDMGFAPDLRRILALLPKDRQTLMFSATMPPELNKVASEALNKPQRLAVDPPRQAAATVTQAFYPVAKHLKTLLLDNILRDIERDGVIIFCRTKHGADRLARQLDKLGHNVAVMHGDRSQSQRERALKGFKRGRVDVLVATDIASRGIDVDDVSHVVNYDVPRAPEDYIHRIGRTGRMNAEGDAFTLVSPEERKEADAIEKQLGKRVNRVMVDGFDYNRARDRSTEERDRGGASRGGREGGRGRSAGGSAPRHGSRPAASSSSSSRAANGNGAAHDAGSADHGRRRKLNANDRRSRKRM